MLDTDKVKKVVAVFELPQRLGIIQQVEYEPQPYAVFVLTTKDGSDAYLTFGWQKAYRAQNGVVKEVELELQRSRYEEYNGKTVEVHRPRDLLAFATTAKEYVRVL